MALRKETVFIDQSPATLKVPTAYAKPNRSSFSADRNGFRANSRNQRANKPGDLALRLAETICTMSGNVVFFQERNIIDADTTDDSKKHIGSIL